MYKHQLTFCLKFLPQQQQGIFNLLLHIFHFQHHEGNFFFLLRDILLQVIFSSAPKVSQLLSKLSLQAFHISTCPFGETLADPANKYLVYSTPPIVLCSGPNFLYPKNQDQVDMNQSDISSYQSLVLGGEFQDLLSKKKVVNKIDTDASMALSR